MYTGATSSVNEGEQFASREEMVVVKITRSDCIASAANKLRMVYRVCHGDRITHFNIEKLTVFMLFPEQFGVILDIVMRFP